jgi:hypothetical protein
LNSSDFSIKFDPKNLSYCSNSVVSLLNSPQFADEKKYKCEVKGKLATRLARESKASFPVMVQ